MVRALNGLLERQRAFPIDRRIAVVPNLGAVRAVALRAFSDRAYLAGLKVEKFLGDGKDPALCNAEGCFDEVLLRQLKQDLPAVKRDTVFVLHLLGSHGPAYYARYPFGFAKFKPECRSNQLQQCNDQQLHNTYDNTILYADHIVASAAAML